MKIIDMKKWQKKRRREQARRSYSWHYQKRLAYKTGAFIIVGYVLHFIVPVWLSVLLALVILTYALEFLPSRWK